MTENEELKKRIEVLEKKVELLEKAFEAIGNVNRSKELEETIEGYSRALKLVELLDSADNSTNKSFDVDAFQKKYEESVEEKRAIDRKIEIDRQIRETAAAQENVNVDDFSYKIIDSSEIYNRTVSSRTRMFYNPFNEHVNSSRREKIALITSFNGWEVKKIVIPNSIQGYPVRAIAADAFEGVDVEFVLLPDTVKVIGEYAFYNCKKLKEVTFGKGIEKICSCAFWNCNQLSGIVLPDSLKSIGSSCFSHTALKSISLPREVEKIDYGCFSACNNLSTVYMSEGLKEICSRSFEGTAITSIVFPKSLESLDVEAVPYSVKIVVFLGNNTKITGSEYKCAFPNGCIVYCNPGSEIQKYARKNGYTVKPLSEFDFSQIE